ncbi:hypothetical protein Aph02nite_79250 [Actinoplanes philippinensis]|uniref:hypothetical protein n=1 Tax=Actinoplanes philippinensis TaxID=35752 RepID=UPI0011609489|nr:hypothetical protein [Actinoplanes philippinensis]GIE81975.1 hypothetical protein Aph02nite_79250 [Actinoplanes philippinensis]
MQMQLGQGDDSSGVVRTDPAPVARLTLVTMVEAGDWAVELPRPLLLHPDEHVWIVGSSLFVRRLDCEVARYEGVGVWLCR